MGMLSRDKKTNSNFQIADSPRRCKPIHWLAGITVVVGVIMVLVAHGHYTVDVLIAYYVTTRLWYIYHTLANNSHLKVSERIYSENSVLS